ncbi:MAG TPA: MFS transporter [Bryobacteraceae bacterium]|jgi:MFS family permease|nr:MFS transporter [Bryobacteraceae bacterium]
MNSQLKNPPVDKHADFNKPRMFFLSVMALLTAGISFSMRTSIADDLKTTFFEPIDKLHSAEMLGAVLGVAFLGFAFTIAIGSPLLDTIGMGRLLGGSGVCFLIGTLIVVFAGSIAQGPAVYNIVWIGMVITGIGWGLVETVINPLTATLYPEDKTAKLNLVHAYWPFGIIVGGLIGLGIGQLNLNWQAKLSVVVIPALIVFIGCLTTRFPRTERVEAGISTKETFREMLRPSFLVWFFCMFLTAAAELAPGQWVDMALTRTVGFQGIWLLIYVSGLMYVMRHFAGPMAHKLSPVGLLWVSCALASGGLLLLSVANSPVTGLVAATVWGTGVCYMWPTMLASAAERFPRGGALLIGLMGTAGTLSIYFVLPQMGKIFDSKAIEAAGGEAAFRALSGDALERVKAVASQASFRDVAILPAVLLVVFGIIWLRDRAKGGYKPVKLVD